MSFPQRAAASTARLNRHFGIATDGTQIQATVLQNAVTAYGDDLSVTLSTEASFTVDCSHPSPYVGTDTDGSRILTGMVTVWIARNDPAITFEPQPGQRVQVLGEHYRIKNVDYQPGYIQLDLVGGAAEGTAGS